MKHLDLFSGIGGFALAARDMGWQTIAFVEIDKFATRILEKNFPGVPIYPDIRKFWRWSADCEPCPMCDEAWCDRCDLHLHECEYALGFELDERYQQIDIVTAGFPCIDLSYAGKGAGLDGEHSGLWTETARILSEVRPRWAVLENVAALLSRGMDRVAGDLAAIGYDCEWHGIPACAIGAPHQRDRIWIICQPTDANREQIWSQPEWNEWCDKATEFRDDGAQGSLADPDRARELEQRGLAGTFPGRFADSSSPDFITDPGRIPAQVPLAGRLTTKSFLERSGGWSSEPGVGRVVDGVPDRMDRLKSLGNAIVPGIARMIFEIIHQVDRLEKIDEINRRNNERMDIG